MGADRRGLHEWRYANQGGPKFGPNQLGVGTDWWAWGNLPGQAPDGTLDDSGHIRSEQQAVWMQLADAGCGTAITAAPPTFAVAPGGLTALDQYDPTASAPSLSADQQTQIAMQNLPDFVKAGMAENNPDTPPLVLSQPGPGGTMVKPVPPAGMTNVDVSGDSGAVAVPGNGQGTVSGSGNVVQAANGTQNLTITGAGNAVTLGPYDDTVTLSSFGNVIKSMGGDDTISLAYTGAPTSAADSTPVGQASNTPLPDTGVGGLSSTGNVFVLPAPGTGTVTIQGQMSALDRIDVTQALAGTTWDHQPGSSMWQDMTAESGPTGCTLSVQGVVVLTVTNGVPNANIGPMLIAR